MFFDYIKESLKNSFLEKCARIGLSVIPIKFRFDKEFFTFLELLHKNESKSYEEIKDYQFKRLKNLILNAYQYSTFYQRKYNEAGFSPNSFKSLDQLSEIPVITREDVRDNYLSMVLSNYKAQKS